VPASGGGGGVAQTPALQGWPLHDLPHIPQLSGSLASATSHPSASLPLQFAKPALHLMPHVVPLHVADVFAGAGQGVQRSPHESGLPLGRHALAQRW